MGGAPESSNQQTEPNVASDAFNFLGPREPVPRAPQMQSKPAQVAAGIYNGAIAPTLDYMASPMGLATAAVPFAGQIPARLTQAAFVPTLAKGAYESGKETQKALNDPQSTTQDIATDASATVGQGAGALMGYKGALESGAGKYLPNKGESGSVGLGSPSSRMKESINAIDEGLEEKPATPLAQFPTSEKGFYSQLQKVLHEKMPNNASVDQIRAIVDPSKGSGVKPDEIKWSNLQGFLEGKKSVTKQEVLDYIKNEGAVKFEEKTISNSNADKKISAIKQKISSVLNGDSEYQNLLSLWRNAEATEKNQLEEKVLDRQEHLTGDLEEELKDAYQEHKESAQPKYAQYTLPNGENYREVVLTMPDDVKDQKQWRVLQKNGLGAGIYWDENIANQKAKDIGGSVEQAETIKSKPNYTSPHFKYIPNYVAHMRLNERPDSEGNKGLFIEELQSDRHQQGREKGYNVPTPLEEIESSLAKKYGTNWKTEATKDEKEQYLEAFAENSKRGQIPDAPFRKDWHTQLFKRALRDAVDKGHDWIGWTKGLDQVKRYENNLRQQVDRIDWEKSPDGSTLINAIKTGQSTFAGRVGADGKFTQAHPYAAGKTLSEIIGKDMAEKIANGNSTGSFSGNDLTVGGEGMKGFYDQILPNEIGKYVKKWGAKVEEGELDNRQPEDNAYYEEPKPEHFTPIWKIKITPEMRESIQQGGQPQVSKDTDIFANLV
jgi:hypothetical protein